MGDAADIGSVDELKSLVLEHLASHMVLVSAVESAKYGRTRGGGGLGAPSPSDASTGSPQVEELKEFARDPIILADDVSPLDGFQFLTGVCSLGRLLRSWPSEPFGLGAVTNLGENC